jgi:hypothetical protein
MLEYISIPIVLRVPQLHSINDRLSYFWRPFTVLNLTYFIILLITFTWLAYLNCSFGLFTFGLPRTFRGTLLLSDMSSRMVLAVLDISSL